MKMEAALRVVNEQIEARIESLSFEVQERLRAIEHLRGVQQALTTMPLWGSVHEATVQSCVVVRDDEFGHLTMADAAAEVLRRAERPLHARDIWFAVMRGGYPHHSKSSYQALVTGLNRLKSRFKRVGPNLFTLAYEFDRTTTLEIGVLAPCAHDEAEHAPKSSGGAGSAIALNDSARPGCP